MASERTGWAASIRAAVSRQSGSRPRWARSREDYRKSWTLCERGPEDEGATIERLYRLWHDLNMGRA